MTKLEETKKAYEEIIKGLARLKAIKIVDQKPKNSLTLVIGDQDTTKLAGHEKSSKHRKAEELITKGQHIKIIGESDFKAMVRIN